MIFFCLGILIIVSNDTCQLTNTDIFIDVAYDF